MAEERVSGSTIDRSMPGPSPKSASLVGIAARLYAPHSMISRLNLARALLAACVAVMFTYSWCTPAAGQIVATDSDDLLDRPISEIQLEGLQRVNRQTVLNNIRSAVGEPFDPAVVRADVARLNRLGQFRFVEADAQLRDDGSVLLLFRVTEQAIIAEVQVVGNRLISDQDLLAVAPLVPGGPRDDFLIQNARRAMEELYRKRGHYLTNVTINQSELDRAGLLIFQVNEGPRVKIRVVEFQGNQAFTPDELWPEIKSRTAMFLFRKGELDEELLADDVAALDRFYKDRGYLDVRVDRQIETSPDGSEAKVTFVIAEGPRYTVRSIRTSTIEGKPLKVFAPEQIAAIIELKEGDVYSRELMRKSIAAIQEAYGAMGYMLSEEDRRQLRSEDWAVIVDPTELRVADAAQVDVIFEILEGRQYRVGEVQVQGNFLTRDKVVRRELINVTPGRPFDTREIQLSEDRLARTRLFNQARITVQREDPDEPGYRDVLVEIKERNTGSINFGVALGSDSGVFGELSLTQNNFDITDTPESLNELITGRAFRGGGQRFNATLRPGTEIFQYVMSLSEPHLFDTDYAGSISGQFRNRIYEDFDEQRIGVSFGLGRQFGDVWQATMRSRVERIELNNIQAEAPTEIFLDAGPDTLTTLGIGVSRTTIPLLGRPGGGSRFEVSYDRYGALGGDIDFNLVNSEYTVFFTLDEDFLGRLTTLKFSTRVGYLWGGRAPVFERFYLGGRTLRGFDFRTVSPKGIRADTLMPSDEPIGGDFLLFVGTQYEFPLLADALTGVVFVDSGTVTESPGFDPYRVSVGFGVRMTIPQFGPNPLAFDFAFPLLKDDSDEEQIFSFSVDLPF
jgi:outer membrane protein insertion porin family